jgi:predicted ferric reductase
MAMGFAAMAMLGVQFALTARFRRATAPFGIDIIYYFHRFAAVLALLMVLGHALIVLADSPGALLPRNPIRAPWHMTAGRLALLCFMAVVVTSLWRKQLRIEYDRWRLWHTLLAAAGFLLALGHIDGAGHSIEAPAKRLLWTAYTAFWVLLVAHIRLVRPWLLSRSPYQVVEVRQETRDVWTLAVEPRRGARIRFRPGQFAWLTARASPFQLKEHPFSFSSSPAKYPRIELTIKELGDFSRRIKDFRPGETVYVDGPYGVFTPERYPAAPGFVFIAGGIGIAPIVSMLRTLAIQGDTRPLTLIYGNWTEDRVVFREEIDELRSRLNLSVVHLRRKLSGFPLLACVRRLPDRNPHPAQIARERPTRGRSPIQTGPFATKTARSGPSRRSGAAGRQNPSWLGCRRSWRDSTSNLETFRGRMGTACEG